MDPLTNEPPPRGLDFDLLKRTQEAQAAEQVKSIFPKGRNIQKERRRMEIIGAGLISFVNEQRASTAVNNSGRHAQWVKGAVKYEFDVHNHGKFDDLPVTSRNIVEYSDDVSAKVVFTEQTRLVLFKAMEECKLKDEACSRSGVTEIVEMELDEALNTRRIIRYIIYKQYQYI